MRAFLITLVFVVLAGLAVAYWLQTNANKFDEGSLLKKTGEALTPDEPEPVLRTPESYHLLQDLGGIPKAEAEQAGLVADGYAYLAAMEPIQQSRGVEQLSDVNVNGKGYDFCYQYNTSPPEQQFLEYNLLGEWDELHFGFGFDDTHPSDPDNKWSIEFRIEVDGVDMFGPEIFTPVNKPRFAKVVVSGASRVTFAVRRVGYNNLLAPVLLDPFVVKSENNVDDQ